MCIYRNSFCPVPFDQQPLNEFYALKNSCFFSFFGLIFRHYVFCLVIVLFTLFFVSLPLFFSIAVNSWITILGNELLFITFGLAIILIRLYLGWSYIMQRLLSATVLYEESGWYDGQIWIKTSEMLTKDRLMASYYVLPLIRNMQCTFLLLFIVTLPELILCYLIC